MPNIGKWNQMCIRDRAEPETVTADSAVKKQERTQEMPEFSVTVTPYEREGSNIKGLARIYFENSFIVNNINICLLYTSVDCHSHLTRKTQAGTKSMQS